MLKKRLFGMMVLIVGVMLAVSLIGCDTGSGTGSGTGGGTGGGNGGGNPPAGSGTGGNPVLNAGEIWKDDARPTEGVRFEGTSFCHYYLANGTWSSRSQEGTWSGNTITRGEGPSSTFTVSGNKLYEYASGRQVAAYTKTTGQTISGNR